MVEYNVSQATTTDLTSAVSDYSVDAQTPDSASPGQKYTYYDYPHASEYLGYYKKIPELKKAVDALAMWVAGKGWTADNRTTVILESITGWGEDSIEAIFNNLIVQKKIFGDAFAEIVRNDEGTLINL